MLRACALSVVLFVSALAAAQVNPQSPEPAISNQAADLAPGSGEPPSPGAIYASILQPLDAIRSDMANWSDIELAAFSIAVKAANEQCLTLQHTAYEAENLFALARVCALGQNWIGTYSAARNYTRSATALHRTEGYGLLVQADLNLQKWPVVIEDLQELHKNIGLTEPAEAIFDYAIRSMEIPRTSYAVQAALEEQPSLLKCLSGCTTGLSPAAAESAAWHTITVLRENGQSSSAAETEILDATKARATPLASAQQEQVAPFRTQAESIGHAIPNDLSRAGCLGSAKPIALKRCRAFYIVLAEAPPANGTLLKAVDDLRSRVGNGVTITVVSSECNTASKTPRVRCAKSDSLLQSLGAVRGPLFLTTDDKGNVTWNVSGSASWLRPNGAAEALAGKQ